MGRLRDAIDGGRDWAEERLLEAANPLFFSLRRRIAFRRRGYRESPERGGPPDGPIAAWMTGDDASRLIARYRLDRFRPRLMQTTFAAVCRHASILDQAFGGDPRRVLTAVAPGSDDVAALDVSALDVSALDVSALDVSALDVSALDVSALDVAALDVAALDIGAKNFEHAPAIHAVLSCAIERRAAVVRLTGVEVDAYRVYRSLHSRHDAATYYLSLLDGGLDRHRYIAGDFLAHTDRYRVVTWSKPFLDPYPLLVWGLPSRLLRPRDMLEHMIGRLEPGGVGVILNQNDEEDDVQRALLDEVGAAYESRAIFDPARPSIPAYAHVVRRDERSSSAR